MVSGGTGGGTQIFSMNSSGLDIGNNKRIHIQLISKD